MNHEDTMNELVRLGACSPARDWAEKQKGMTAEELIAACPENKWLAWAVCYAPDEYRDRAAQVLLDRNASDWCMRDIVCYAPDEYRDRAWQVLLDRNASDWCMRDIVRY